MGSLTSLIDCVSKPLYTVGQWIVVQIRIFLLRGNTRVASLIWGHSLHLLAALASHYTQDTFQSLCTEEEEVEVQMFN